MRVAWLSRSSNGVTWFASNAFRENTVMFPKFGFALFASILTSAIAHAAVFTVGTDGACTHNTIESAAAAAEASPGADTIRVAFVSGNPTYFQQAITISASQELDIVGGYTDCSQAQSSGSHIILDGGGAGPVFHITVNSGGYVRLGYFTIQNGVVNSSGKGGGIYFTGEGGLQLDHMSIVQNTAGSGGGIYADGTGSGAGRLVIGTDVAIVNNNALGNGGGVAVSNMDMTMIQANSYIANNHAPSGKGGGIYFIGGQTNRLFLGSSGFGNAGAIYLNNAKQGGGVAVQGYFPSSGAELHLFTTDSARPVRIKGNTASDKGGGIYFADNYTQYSLWAWNAWIEDNIAPHGAAIFGVQLADAIAFNDPSHRPAGSVDCPVGSPCGGIVGNAAVDESSQPTGGIVEANYDANWNFNRITISGNTGRSVLTDDHKLNFLAHNVAITGNTVTGSVISTDNDNDDVELSDVTIAGNAIGDSTVLRFGNTGRHVQRQAAALDHLAAGQDNAAARRRSARSARRHGQRARLGRWRQHAECRPAKSALRRSRAWRLFVARRIARDRSHDWSCRRRQGPQLEPARCRSSHRQ